MSKKKYTWKRFWCPRSGNISLTDSGYLFNPETSWGKICNPDLVSLEEISDIPCLVLLGEPGIGKSQELENLIMLTRKKDDDSCQVLELNLRSCRNLKDDLFRDENFIDWLSGTFHLYLFLDSLDEGLLSIPNITTGLIDELRKPKYKNHIKRLHFRIACRTFIFPEILEEGLKDLWGKAYAELEQNEFFAIYELAPLRQADVIESIKTEGLSPDEFLKEVNQKNLVSLAIKPITLGFLLNRYRRHEGQFPQNQKLHELYLDGCKLLCEEVSKGRLANNQTGCLDGDQRLIIAARIAAVTIFTNQFAIFTSVDHGDKPDEDVPLQTLCPGYEEANGRELAITREAVKEVLDNTGLFSSRGLNRTGWAHQTYAEFLAAWYLIQHEVPIHKLMDLVSQRAIEEKKIVPQLYETVSWIAGMIPEVFEKVLLTDPNVLLLYNPNEINDQYKSKLITSILLLIDEGHLPRQYTPQLYRKFNYPNLIHDLRSYISDVNKSINSRLEAIDIAEACQETALLNVLVDLALDASEIYEVRVKATMAISRFGSNQVKHKLRSLALNEIDSDPEDDITGYALLATWPELITAIELFSSLTKPKKLVFGGVYQNFVASEVSQHLKVSDFEVALDWVKNRPIRSNDRYPFKELSDQILNLAWANNDCAEIMQKFVECIIPRFIEYGTIFIDDNGKTFTELLKSDYINRQKIISVVINTLPDNLNIPYRLYSYFDECIIFENDLEWLLDCLNSEENISKQEIWAIIIDYCFNLCISVARIELILPVYAKNLILNKRLYDQIESIELDSEKAEECRIHLRHQLSSTQPLLKPTPSECIENSLKKIEDGEEVAWCQLCVDLGATLYVTSSEIKQDITELPGWENATEITRDRILSAAKTFIITVDPCSSEWISTNTIRKSALYEYMALYLIVSNSIDSLETFNSPMWVKWVPSILAFPLFSEDKYSDYRKYIIKQAYQNATEEFIDTLMILMDKVCEYDYFDALTSQISHCLDSYLGSKLLSKVKQPHLKLESFSDLLSVLILKNIKGAKQYAQSLLKKVPTDDEILFSKAVEAARVLLLHSRDAGWSAIWPKMQNDNNFGKAVLESVACDFDFNDSLEERLLEHEISDLFIYLHRTFPEQQFDSSQNTKAQSKNQLEYQYDDDFDAKDYELSTSDYIRTWREAIPARLQKKGTIKAHNELLRIIIELPETRENLEWRLLETKNLVQRLSWNPLQPHDLLDYVATHDKYLVQDGEQLLEVLIQSLNRLQQKLQGETPCARDIWDRLKDGSFQPLDENAFSDYVKRFLEEDLGERGIVLNREVEIRRGYGGNSGERTDIHVNALLRESESDNFQNVTSIIEVKGCWNKDLKTAMNSQLFNRYLTDNSCSYGLYLVGWFQCSLWNEDDSRKKRNSSMELIEIRDLLDDQAKNITANSLNIVKSYVLNAALK